jgi:lysozyme
MNVPYLHAGQTKLMLQVKADLERHEGFREYAYPDPLSALGRRFTRAKGYNWGFEPARQIMARIPNAQDEDGAPWTYGFGFTHCVTPDSRISRIAAERMLESLILEQDIRLSEKLSWYKDTSFVNKTVLINMAFNLGLVGLLKFRNTLRYISEKNYEQAALNMTLSLWFSQVGSRAVELVWRMRHQRIQELWAVGDNV